MPELVFAQIDAKDDIHCGYHTVGVCYNDANKRGPRSFTNAEILALAEGEYLKRLHELQIELREKYEPMFEDDSDRVLRPWEGWEDLVDWAPIEAYRHLRYT